MRVVLHQRDTVLAGLGSGEILFRVVVRMDVRGCLLVVTVRMRVDARHAVVPGVGSISDASTSSTVSNDGSSSDKRLHSSSRRIRATLVRLPAP